jgi:hypothetical protein
VSGCVGCRGGGALGPSRGSVAGALAAADVSAGGRGVFAGWGRGLMSSWRRVALFLPPPAAALRPPSALSACTSLVVERGRTPFALSFGGGSGGGWLVLGPGGRRCDGAFGPFPGSEGGSPAVIAASSGACLAAAVPRFRADSGRPGGAVVLCASRALPGVCAPVSSHVAGAGS